MMVMSASAPGGTPGPESGSGKVRNILETAFGPWLPGLPKRQLIEYAKWHITMMEENLGKVSTGGKASGGSPSITEMQWHTNAVRDVLDRVPTAARKRWLIDLAGLIALIALIVSVSVFIGTWASTNSDNGGLHERVNALQDQVTALQGQLTDVRGSYGQLTKLVDNQLEMGNISVQTALRYVPDGRGLCSCGQALVIRSPARPTGNNPAVVPGAITVTGTINMTPKEIEGQSIWILISTPGINRYYPQGSASDGVGPAVLDANHQWTSPTVLVGGPGDKGRIFYVIAVLADGNATNAFANYLKVGASTGKFPGLNSLPKGATEYDRVEVVRS